MTREEAIATAIATLESIKQFGIDKWIFNKKEIEAFDMAIEAMQAMQAKTDGDLISKQDAIRWVKTECNPYGKPTLDFESGKKVIEHLEQMPSAETPTFQQKHQLSEETPTDAPTDLISRADAMGTVQDHFNADGFKGYDDGQKMMDRIKALPSADRPTELLKDGTLKVNVQNGADVNRVLICGDDGFGGLYYADDRPNIAYFCDGAACDGECNECHHTTDIKHAKNFNCIGGKYNIKYIETDYRPSGEWIMHIDDLYPEESTQECTNCHEHETIKINNDNYCPNCGAKMGGNK